MQSESNTRKKAQVVYFSHGGGPLPILGDASHRAMVDFMTRLPARLAKPEAIVVISAHWEESTPTVLGADHPPLYFDYYGFPDEAYAIRYPVPGSPELARRITEHLGEHDFSPRLDLKRGFDHGLFIPLMLMVPQADIPSVQISLIRGLDPETHIAMGKALRRLLSENVLIIGSGFSFHNMSAFSWRADNRPDPGNDEFQNWLTETCTQTLSPEQREKRLINWQQAPSARYAHPREEHLLPLHVCQGLAESAGELIFDDYILGKRAVAFLWE